MAESGTSTVAAEVAQQLTSDYSGEVPKSTVRTIVAGADADLAGQVPRGALPELLHRLAGERLARISRTSAR